MKLSGGYLMQQVGSYFGATLCSVDLNQDTSTDLVLVGAPMYYDATAGGRVHVCLFKVGNFWIYETQGK